MDECNCSTVITVLYFTKAWYCDNLEIT